MAENKKKQAKIKSFVAANRVDPFLSLSSSVAGSSEYWRWGDDNLFPVALALLSRQSTAHRRIINDKASYISGKELICDENQRELCNLIAVANGSGESLRAVLHKVALDKCLFGNAYLEIVTNRARSFMSFYHQDATKCRVSKSKDNEANREHILLHHNWQEFTLAKAKRLPVYPKFEEQEDGTLRSIVHYKDYEPMFENYGVPPYIAGLSVSAIAYKTDQWNISRLDNSFQLSGVLILDASVDSEEEAGEIQKLAKEKFAGKPGQVMFLLKSGDGTDRSQFVPIQSSNEGDWEKLHDQATTDIVIAHSWYRSLSGMDYSSGFSTDRILHEYEIALNNVIRPAQVELLEPIMGAIDGVLGLDASSLLVVNRPPIQTKPYYMKIWEARKNDGLEYDENDPEQQRYLAELRRTRYDIDN